MVDKMLYMKQLTARQFQHDEDTAGIRRWRLCRQRLSSAREQGRNACQAGRANTQAVQAGLQQFSAFNHRAPN